MALTERNRARLVNIANEKFGFDLVQSVMFPQAKRKNALARTANEEQTIEIKAEISRLSKLSSQELAIEEHQISMAADAKRSPTGFYFHSDAYLDDVYWSKMPFWSLEEGVILLTGRDPRKVTFNKLLSLKNVSYYANYVLDLKELAYRACGMAQLAESNLPSVFLTWAKDLNLSIDESILRAVEAENGAVATTRMALDKAQADLLEQLELNLKEGKRTADLLEVMEAQTASLERYEDLVGGLRAEIASHTAKSKDVSRRPDSRVLASLEKIILAMAADAYGYRPTAAKNTATKDIVNAAAEFAISISDETVRSTLKRCAMHWSDENEPK